MSEITKKNSTELVRADAPHFSDEEWTELNEYLQGKHGKIYNIAEKTANNFLTLYLAGRSITEIQESFPEWPRGAILHAAYHYGWHLKKQEHLSRLMKQSKERLPTVQMEIVNHALDRLTVAHAQFRKEMERYLQNPIPENLPRNCIRSTGEYKQVLEIIEKAITLGRRPNAKDQDGSQGATFNVNITTNKDGSQSSVSAENSKAEDAIDAEHEDVKNQDTQKSIEVSGVKLTPQEHSEILRALANNKDRNTLSSITYNEKVIGIYDFMLLPCRNEEDLHNWIITFFGLDMPNCTVCGRSTSNPMHMIWKVYQAAKDGLVEESSQLYFASRDSYKTLSAAIIEVLIMLHFRRTASHMGAIKQQSKKCYDYFKRFMSMKPLNQVKCLSDTQERTELDLPNPWNMNPYLQIVICTMQGANCVKGDSTHLTLENGNTKLVKDVSIGEKVLTYDHKQDCHLFLPVLNKSISMPKPTYFIHANTGEVLHLSHDHPIFIDEKWKKAEDVKEGDTLVHATASNCYVTRKIDGPVCDDLYDIEIDTDTPYLKAFVANNIFVKNSEHTHLLTIDEVDVVKNVQAYREAKKIPSETPDKKPSITLYISTRKSSFGLVQHEVDNAKKSGLKVRSWNIIDVGQACPPDKSRIDEGTVTRYYKENDLVIHSKDTMAALSPADAAECEEVKLYNGCLSCSIAPLCLGRLATKQTGTSLLLKSHADIEKKFRESEIDDALAQLMCYKPSLHGLVFSRLNEAASFMSITQMWEKVTGEKADKEITKQELIDTFHKHNIPSFCGIDWGWHTSICLVAFIDSRENIYVVHELALSHIDDPDFVDIVKTKIHPIYKVQMYFPDTENPSGISLMLKENLPTSKKVVKDIHLGIQTIKKYMKLPGLGTTKFYMLDEECPGLVKELRKYHLQLDAAGQIISHDKYADEFNHRIDSLRYIITNILGRSTALFEFMDLPSLSGKRDDGLKNKDGRFQRTPTAEELASHLGRTDFGDNRDDTDKDKDPKKGGNDGGHNFNWSM